MSLDHSTSGPKRSGNLGIGCLALLAIPFLCMGIAVGNRSIKGFLKGETKEGLFFLLASVLCVGIGLGFLIGAFFASKSQKKLNLRKAAHPDKPWLWREDWASRRIPSSNKAIMYVGWVMTPFWILISSGICIALPGAVQKGNRLILIGLLFPIFSVFLLIWTVRVTIIWKKFGQSYFKLLNNPGTIGGQLDGVIETSTKIQPQGGLKLRCYCVHLDSTGKNTSEHVLWEEEKVIIKNSLSDPRRSAFPVLFQIPDDCSPTDDSVPNHKTIWRLEAKAKTTGTDYSAQFEVPVFKAEIQRPIGKGSESFSSQKIDES